MGSWFKKVIKARFDLVFVFLVFSNLAVFFLCILPRYPVYSHYDGWIVFTRELKQLLRDPSHVMFSEYDFLYVDEWWTYWHSFTPLYPFLAALVSLLAGNVMISMILTSLLFSFTALFYARKIAMEFLHLDHAKTSQLLSIMVSCNFISHFFTVPLPISMTLALPVAGTYFIARYFKHGQNWKDGIKLSLVFTITMFSREIIWVLIVVPLGMLFFFQLAPSRQEKPPVRLFLKRATTLLFTTVVIPCVVYGTFLLGSNTIVAMLVQVNSITRSPKLMGYFLYMFFNSIVFGWIFVLFNFVRYLRTLPGRHDGQAEILGAGTLLFIFTLSFVFADLFYIEVFDVRIGHALIITLLPLVLAFVVHLSVRTIMAIRPVLGHEHECFQLGRDCKNDEVVFSFHTGESTGDDGNDVALIERVNSTWFLVILASRIILPGSLIEANIVPVGFVLALYMFKGTSIVQDARVKEVMFWILISLNVTILYLQVLPFIPFFGLDFTSFIPGWLRGELGWPF